jgi:hypothetical protein
MVHLYIGSLLPDVPNDIEKPTTTPFLGLLVSPNTHGFLSITKGESCIIYQTLEIKVQTLHSG